MELTNQEQELLNGEKGQATQKAMQILVALGKIYGADKMIRVSSVQVAAVSYKTLGDAGIEYLEEMVKGGAKVQVKTFLNPAGLDRDQWKQMKFPEKFAKRSFEALDCYQKMGIAMTCTCTPYLIGIQPKVGEHIAWAESSAVSFANSVLGARTNREGGPSALAAAICGVTPNYGLHLDENRASEVTVKVETEVKTSAGFGALGAFVGNQAKHRHPSFIGIKNAKQDQLKGLGAAMAAWGSVALYYVKGITPEYIVSDSAEQITVEKNELEEMKEKMGVKEKPELVTIGCPHASFEEIEEVANLVKGKKLGCKLWVCTAKKTKEKAKQAGFVSIIEEAGGKVVADTCMVVCPLEEMGYKITGCNSGKAAKYLASACKQKVVYGNIEDLVFK